MNYPIVRLVSAPDVDATTRFDFHEWADDVLCCWTDPNEWQIQPGALLGEPDGIGADFGLGSVTFNLYVRTSRRAALAQMGRLARELRREENYLLFQLSADTLPIWYRTYKASPGALGFPFIDPDADEDVWVLPVSLVTDATGLGEQVSHTLTITNDPADGGLFAVLPEIVGDAPAPLDVELESGAAGDAYSLLSVLAVDADYDALQFWQAESGAVGWDASVQVSGSASGGSWVSVSFATDETMVQRLAVGAIPPLAGRYRIFARVAAVDCTVTIQGGDAGALIDRPSASVVDGDEALIDLGVYAWPNRNPPTRRPYNLTTESWSVLIEARRDSGTGSLKIDYVVAIPVDLPLDQAAPPRLLEWATEGAGAPSSDLIRRLDSEAGRAVLVNPTGNISDPSDSAWTTQPIGGFPEVVPGVTNVVHFLPRHKVGSNWSDALATETELRLTYRPRHLWLPGS